MESCGDNWTVLRVINAGKSDAQPRFSFYMAGLGGPHRADRDWETYLICLNHIAFLSYLFPSHDRRALVVLIVRNSTATWPVAEPPSGLQTARPGG